MSLPQWTFPKQGTEVWGMDDTWSGGLGDVSLPCPADFLTVTFERIDMFYCIIHKVTHLCNHQI